MIWDRINWIWNQVKKSSPKLFSSLENQRNCSEFSSIMDLIQELKNCLRCVKCSAVPENSLHQCQNGCFQVCSDCLPENSKCQECLEYCIVTPKVANQNIAHHFLKISEAIQSFLFLRHFHQLWRETLWL